MGNNNSGNGGEEQGSKELEGKESQKALRELQTKLVEMQEWVKATGAKVVFEGRDAALKGGVINNIMACVSPRVFRHVALPGAHRSGKESAIRTTLHVPTASCRRGDSV